MSKDMQLYIYLEQFKLDTYLLENHKPRRCDLCGLKARLFVVVFSHLRLQTKLVRDLCQSCKTDVLDLHAQLQAKKDFHAEKAIDLQPDRPDPEVDLQQPGSE